MNNKKMRVWVCATIIMAISAVLTVPSMWLIKNIPGNKFKTDMDFIATALLVFLLWFSLMAICIWLTRSLINSRKLKKYPSSANAQMRTAKKNQDLKTISTARRAIIGFLNVVFMYFLIMLSVGACVFLGQGMSTTGWIIFVIANACIILLLLACAISDLIMMIKINRNPYNQKAIVTREKGKKFFVILIALYILLYILTFTFLSLSNH